MRVPMIVMSPWSRGGYVNSQVFDHTSLIQFIERRFGVKENNITPWRRAVAGDLTSAFNFVSPNDAVVRLPSTTAYLPKDNKRHPDYRPAPPAQQAMPVQEPGTRPARALPYEFNVHGQANLSSRTVNLVFSNTGRTAAVFHVRSGNSHSGPWTYTVGPNETVSDNWTFATSSQTAYDLSVYGPNGFLRTFKGSIVGSNKANLQITSVYDTVHNSITLNIVNPAVVLPRVNILDARADNLNARIKGPSLPAVVTSRVTVLNVYTKKTVVYELKPGAKAMQSWPLASSFGWYDFVVEVSSDSTFEQRIAGHLEIGKDSMSDPAIGAE
jgi:phospholipase C